MEDKEIFKIYESSQARADKRFRQMWILVLVLVLMLVGTNVAWIYYEGQYENIVTTVTQDAEAGEGNAIIYGNDAGEVNYGESTSDSNH